jgi:hypothetical protein
MTILFLNLQTGLLKGGPCLFQGFTAAQWYADER